jgi:hypothetical protein
MVVSIISKSFRQSYDLFVPAVCIFIFLRFVALYERNEFVNSHFVVCIVLVSEDSRIREGQ